MALAIVVFAATLALILIRPKPLNEGTAAALGAIAVLATGVVSLLDVFEELRNIHNILLFFLGLVVISTVAEQAGFFKWCAHEAMVLAKGNARRLLIVAFGLAVVITALFSNDAAASMLPHCLCAGHQVQGAQQLVHDDDLILELGQRQYGTLVRMQPHLRQCAGRRPRAKHHYPRIPLVDVVAGPVEVEGAGYSSGRPCEARPGCDAADAGH